VCTFCYFGGGKMLRKTGVGFLLSTKGMIAPVPHPKSKTFWLDISFIKLVDLFTLLIKE
jgi:hypothetical protein